MHEPPHEPTERDLYADLEVRATATSAEEEAEHLKNEREEARKRELEKAEWDEGERKMAKQQANSREWASWRSLDEGRSREIESEEIHHRGTRGLGADNEMADGRSGLSQPRCPCHGCLKRYWRLIREAKEERKWPDAKSFYETKKRKADEATKKAREEQERHLRKQREKEREAEEKKAKRNREAAERKKQAQERTANARSQEAARRAREFQERAALIRISHAQLRLKREEYLKQLDDTDIGEVAIDIGWTKKKGAAKCLFCDDDIKYYSFRCPSGGAVACNPCKNKLSRFSPSMLSGDVEVEDGGEP